MKYYKYYIQKEAAGSALVETGADFGMYEMESDFYGGGSAKELAKRDWHDEDGDDEFVPSVLRLSAMEMSVKFGYKGAFGTANAAVLKFLDYLKQGGEFRVYDEYNRVGRRHVRFSSIGDDAELTRYEDEGDLLIFTVKLKVNDPATNVVPAVDMAGAMTGLKDS